MNIIVIAPHPDDEVLGMGGTIKKLSKKNKVTLCVVTEGASEQYSNPEMINIRRNSCIKAAKILGISNIEFLNFPDMRLDTVPHVELNKKIEQVIRKYDPQIVYVSTNNDLNKDHQKVFESTLIATRPLKNKVKEILAYEIPGVIFKPFEPNVYEDVSKEFLFKIKALKQYKSEIEKFPRHRSLDAINNLAIRRGIEAGLKKAEAFQLIRRVS